MIQRLPFTCLRFCISIYVGTAMENILLKTLSGSLYIYHTSASNKIIDSVLPVDGLNLFDTSLRNHHRTKVIR